MSARSAHLEDDLNTRLVTATLILLLVLLVHQVPQVGGAGGDPARHPRYRPDARPEHLDSHQFRLAAITPPEAVQTSIDRVQGARAQVSEAQARSSGPPRGRGQPRAGNRVPGPPACAAIDRLREAKNPRRTSIYIGIDPVIPTR